MTDSPFDDSAPEEEKPDELPALPAGKPEEPVDPLLRLRQSLKDEESQTTDTQKSGGFLQRMASGFTPKKTTKKSKEEEEQVISPLGSKLSTNVPSSSSVAPSDSEEPKPAEEIQDELLEKRLGTPDQHDWRRSKSTFDDVEESKELMRWYKRLVNFQAVKVLEAIHIKMPLLRNLLPSAARVLDAVLVEAEK